jgi:hypothetical protein
MPIDERLRAALQWQSDHEAREELDLLPVIVGRATRRHRIRLAGVGVAAAAAAALVAIALPLAMSRHDQDGQPVGPLPPSPRFTLSESQLDSNWVGSQGAKADRLAALEGTGLERFANAVYAEHIAHSTTRVQFFNGEVSLSTRDMATEAGISPDGDPNFTLHGTFAVRGRTVVMQFNEVPGTTTFQWKRTPEDACERLELTFVGTTVTRVYDAPAEAYFRMWSAGPFEAWGC